MKEGEYVAVVVGFLGHGWSSAVEEFSPIVRDHGAAGKVGGVSLVFGLLCLFITQDHMSTSLYYPFPSRQRKH